MAKALASSKFQWKSQYRIGTSYIVDFYCRSIKAAIEVDGSSHDAVRKVSDTVRDKALLTKGIATYRIRDSACFDAAYLERWLTRNGLL
jgi:very-short-patch-repair endonuclease